MKDSRPNLPRPSQIVDRMVQGRKYTPTRIAFMFDSNLALTQKLLKTMLDDGVITGSNAKGREREYFLPEVEETPPGVAAARTVHAFTPPLNNDMATARNAFVAGCMAVRRG